MIEHANLRTRDLALKFGARHTGDLPVLFIQSVSKKRSSAAR